MSFGIYAQAPADSVYYNRLFYVCKAWGHVKYYHTETANGSVIWDDALLDALSGIKNAPDNSSFNDSLLLMLASAGEMGIVTGNLPNVPDSLNNNTDYTWIQNSIFSDSARAILDTIRARFRPQSNVYVGELWVGGSPNFISDTLYSYESYYPNEEKRVLALFRYWNIINYFYPYKYIMDQDWDTTLVEFIPQIIDATDELSYNQVFKKLTKRLNDSHAFLISTTYYTWIGYHQTPFLSRYIENEMVITKVIPQVTEVKVGDIIKEIDGFNIYELRDSIREYAHGSNDAFIETEIDYMIMRDYYGYFPIVVENETGTHSDSLYRTVMNISRLSRKTGPIWKDTLINSTCNFGIVDMGRLEDEDVSAMFSELWNTDAIIFDIRSYPQGTLWSIVDYLYSSSISIANFTIPDITYPGRLYWHYEQIGTGTSDAYQGNIIILFDERTLSQAEYTCMGLEQFKYAYKIGSTTAAADGNVASIYLPGDLTTMATFLGTYYPDFTPTQRVGIIPDFEVLPTIQGFRDGRDEVLEFALNCYFIDVKEIETSDNLKLYPNPVSKELHYELPEIGNDDILLIEIIDIYGRVVATEEKTTKQGRINFSNLVNGTYIVKVTSNNMVLTKVVVKH